MIFLLLLVHGALLAISCSNLLYLRRTKGEVPRGRPSVSVLIPARNEAENLRRLLPSLLSQEYPEYEVIVYDDGSEDGTWEVLQSFASDRFRTLRGSGPPPGWAGKVHALYQATREACGERFLFLDADAHLLGPAALARLVDHHERQPKGSVLTGLTRLRGGGLLLVSLVPFMILTGLPWPLVRRLPIASLGALNGQCWMIDAELYRRFEPHAHLPSEVLEDVMIGRYLKARGVVPVLVDVQHEVEIFMYRHIAEAWTGFRKNAYLMLGGHPLSFAPLFALFVLVYAVAPFLSPWLLGTAYLLKLICDRRANMPPWITLVAPLSFVLGVVLQLDSAISHWTGRATWKGRRVP